MSTFEKRCGDFTLYISPPSPRWVTIKWEDQDLIAREEPFEDHGRRAHIKIEDLNDLRYLIDRALAEQ